MFASLFASAVFATAAAFVPEGERELRGIELSELLSESNHSDGDPEIL